MHRPTLEAQLVSWAVDHLDIYSGNGNLIHASSYFGQVVESKMRYIRGYWGARRLNLR